MLPTTALGCGSRKEPLQPGDFLLSCTSKPCRALVSLGGHTYVFTIFLIVFHIYLSVKHFLFLISLSYLFVLAHPLGEETPNKDVLPLSLSRQMGAYYYYFVKS